MIGWMHKMREATVILLQFVAVCSLLSMVQCNCATTPELRCARDIPILNRSMEASAILV